jgi:hypothetical protein
MLISDVFWVMWTTYCSCWNSCLEVELDDAECVSSSTFDHADIEEESVTVRGNGSMSAAHVKVCIAALEVTFDRWQTCGHTIRHGALLFESLPWNEANSLRIVEDLSIAELDLLGPKSTVDMHPIVPRSSLERLSGSYGSTCSFLVLAPFSQDFRHLLSVEALLLAVAVSLLLV